MSIHQPELARAAALHAQAAAAPALSPATLRALLVLGTAVAVAIAAAFGDPAAALRADPELATLLRGMAALKALLCAGAVAALWWRFGHAIAPRTAAGYLVGAWLAAGAAMMVWQLASIPLAALVFHAGEFTLLIVAWRDGRGRLARGAPSA